MPNPVSADDLEARWRPLTDAEMTVAQTLIDDAWNLVTTTVPIEAYMTAGSVNADTVRRVVCAAVLRVLRNPEGYRSESIDDWTGVRDSAVSTGELYLSPGELAQLRPDSHASSGAYVVSLGG